MKQINKNSIPRLVKYKQVLRRRLIAGEERIYSTDLAAALGVTPEQVRKDFSLFSITGNKRGGYLVDELLLVINRVLGRQKEQKVIIVGMGNLGQALLNYDGFQDQGIRIVAGFDNDAKKCQPDADIPIYPAKEMKDFIRKKKMKVAVLAVPASAAQNVANEMMEAGVEGILNFAPVRLKTEGKCLVRDVLLSVELESVMYFVNATKEKNA